MCSKILNVHGQNTSVIIPGSITQLTDLNSVLFLGEALVQGRLVVRQGMPQGEAYICWELELCMSTRAGNASTPIFLPFLGHFSLLPAFPNPRPWRDRACPAGDEACRRQTAARKEKTFPAFPPTHAHMHQSLGGVYIWLPALQKGGMAQLSLGWWRKCCLWLSLLQRVRWGQNCVFPEDSSAICRIHG